MALTGRVVLALTFGAHRPRSFFFSDLYLGRCDRFLAPDCAGVDDDSHVYADEIRRRAEESPSGKVDVVAWSYSAFELSITLEKEPDVKDVIDHVILLSPTQVRTSAFDDVSVTVLYEEGDPIRSAPFGFGPRLHNAMDIPEANRVRIAVDVEWEWWPETPHTGWFKTENEIMMAAFADLVRSM